MKIFGWIFLSVILLLLVVVLAINLPVVQNFITGKAINYLEGEIGTKVELDYIGITFPKKIVLEGLYLEDQQQDTLTYVGYFGVDIEMLGLLKQQVKIDEIELDHVRANIYKTLPDSAFNFDYIIEAFAGEGEVEQDTAQQEGEPWDIQLRRVALTNIGIRYVDEPATMDVAAHLNALNVTMEAIRPEDDFYSIASINLDGLTANYALEELIASVEEEAAVPSVMPDIKIGDVKIKNVAVDYRDKPAGLSMELALKSFSTRINALNLPENQVDIREVLLEETQIAIVMDTPLLSADTVTPGVEAADTAAMTSWKVAVNNINFDNIAFSMLDKTVPRQPGMDFGNLDITDFSLDIQDVQVDGTAVNAQLNNLAMKDHSGFVLERLQANIDYHDQGATLDGLLIKTPHTEISNYLAVSYPSLETIENQLQTVNITTVLKDVRIGFQDILLLAPDLAAQPPFSKMPQGHALLNLDVKGSVDDLLVNAADLSLGSNTKISFSGKLRGLPDMDRMIVTIPDANFKTSRTDLYAILEDTLLNDFGIPEQINLQAAFTGSLHDFKTDLSLETTLGGLAADFEIMQAQSEMPSYIGNLSINELDLGKLLKADSMLGKLAFVAELDGRGLEPEKMDVTLNAEVEHLEFQEYDYKAIRIDGRLVEMQFNGKAGMEDDNLQFDFEGLVDMGKEVPKLDFTLNLEGINFQALNLMDRPLALQAKIVADFTGDDIDNLNGNLIVSDVLIVDEGLPYNMDTLKISAVNEPGNSIINIDSELLSAQFNSNLNPSSLIEQLQKHFDGYYSLQDDELDALEGEEYFDFKIRIPDTELLTALLVPELDTFQTASIEGHYRAKDKYLQVEFDFPQIVYSGIGMDTLAFNVLSDSRKIDYDLSVQNVSNPSFRIPYLGLAGKVEDDVIDSELSILDDDRETKFNIGFNFQSVDTAFRFVLQPNQLVLDYEAWNVSPDNFLLFGGERLIAENFELTNNQQLLRLVSLITEQQEEALEVDFENFSLVTISRMLEEEDQELVRGVLNGNLQVLQRENFGYAAALEIADFAFMGDIVGNLDIQSKSEGPERFDVNIGLDGNGNDLLVKGTYFTEDVENAFDINIDINRIDLARFEGFTGGALTRLKGDLTGALTLRGNVDDPKLRGNIEFQETAFNLEFLDSYFTIAKERIKFDDKGIHFDKFRIKDERENPATIAGSVLTKDYQDYEFKLDITTRNFRGLNTVMDLNDPEQLYYGKVIFDSDIRVRGDLNLPDVRLDLKLRDGTDLTLVVPQSQAALVEREGVVEFYNPYDSVQNSILDVDVTEPRDTMRAELTGINLNAVLQVDERAKFKIFIDPSGGDSLVFRGNADANLSIDPAGNMNLSGRFEIAEGNYRLSFYNFVRKSFDIAKGSTITWSGDPMDAVLDIRAIYRARTAPNTLFLGGQAEDPQLRQLLPFLVYLNMQGELLNPDISFGLDMPVEVRGVAGGTVYNRIAQLQDDEAERNKQVFGLLVLNSFIAEDPLAGGGGNAVNAAARNTVSNILSNQLNRLSDQYIQGVDLNVGVQSYEDGSTPTGRTELQLGLSTQFLNDRLTVQVGSNIDLEGERRRAQGGSDIAGDVSVRYKLTEDGRYQLDGFRRHDFGVLEGEVIKTGLGLIFTREYNQFRNLFKKPETINNEVLEEYDESEDEMDKQEVENRQEENR